MTLVLFLACVPAAVYGLRFDGSMPQNSEISAVGGVFPGSMGEDLTLADTSVAGLVGRQRLGNEIAVAVAGGFAPSSLDGSPAGVVELELQGRVLNEAPVTLSVLGGLDAYGQVDAESLMFGAHAGAIVSRRLPGSIRPYAGVKINPVYNPGDAVYPWLQYGGGVSWRPRLDPSTRGLLAVEASGYHGFGADLVTPGDIVTWGMMVQVGASFGNEVEE